MKRPLMVMGFAVALGQTAAVFLAVGPALVLGALAAAVGVASFFCRRTRQKGIVPLALLCAATAVFVSAGYQKSVVEPARELDGARGVVTMRISAGPERHNGGYQYVVDTAVVQVERDGRLTDQDVPQHLKLRLNSDTPLQVSLYDVVTADVYFGAPGGGMGYTSKISYQAQGVYLFANLRSGVTKNGEAPRDLWYGIMQARAAMLFQMGSLLPPSQSSLIAGLTLGETAQIPDQVIADFRNCGVSHLLAVSGLHTAFFAQMLLCLFLGLRMPRRLCYALSAAGVLGFAALSGFTPSVSRAAVMSLLYLLGGIIFRKPDSLNSLGLAALVLCVANPCIAGGINFQLSFLSTFGIILLAEPIGGWMISRFPHGVRSRFSRGMVTMAATSLSAMVCAFPVILLVFGEISLASPLANVATVLPAEAAMACGMLASLLSFFEPLLFLAKPLALIAGVLSNYLMSATHLLASAGLLFAPGEDVIPLWIGATFLCAAGTILVMKRKRAVLTAGLLSLVVLLVLSLTDDILRNGTIRIGVMDSGEGVAVAMVWDGGGWLLSSGQSRATAYRCEDYLAREGGGKLDLLIAPDGERKSALVQAQLMETCRPRVGWFGSGPLDDALLAAMGEDCELLQDGGDSGFRFGEKISVQRIASAGGAWYHCRAWNISVLVGDGVCDAADLPPLLRAADLLVLGKLPDHAELLRANVLVVSATQEQTPYLAAKLSPLAAYLYTTSQNGTISMRTTGGRDLIFR